jgi:hypothetical protein
MDKITGLGAIEVFDLDELSRIPEDVRSFGIEPGKFVRRYELSKSGGGNVMTFGANLHGAMYEFDNVFCVIWSCGEYIDIAVIKKDQ